MTLDLQRNKSLYLLRFFFKINVKTFPTGDSNLSAERELQVLAGTPV